MLLRLQPPLTRLNQTPADLARLQPCLARQGVPRLQAVRTPALGAPPPGAPTTATSKPFLRLSVRPQPHHRSVDASDPRDLKTARVELYVIAPAPISDPSARPRHDNSLTTEANVALSLDKKEGFINK